MLLEFFKRQVVNAIQIAKLQSSILDICEHVYYHFACHLFWRGCLSEAHYWVMNQIGALENWQKSKLKTLTQLFFYIQHPTWLFLAVFMAVIQLWNCKISTRHLVRWRICQLAGVQCPLVGPSPHYFQWSAKTRTQSPASAHAAWYLKCIGPGMRGALIRNQEISANLLIWTILIYNFASNFAEDVCEGM